MAQLRVFGNIAYVHVPKEKQRKLDAKVEKCIVVGYSDEKKGYKCYDPKTKQVRVSRDAMSCSTNRLHGTNLLQIQP